MDSLRDSVEDDVSYYNNERNRLKLKGLSPVQYRTQPLNHRTLQGQFLMAGLGLYAAVAPACRAG
ncbi:IS3 family transposase [Rhizobium glycinendophyticum]|uniref:IS3 family transposase n=1 Tax=Rhizobium glycinendophyticum TaxID=2589807 RepID=A0A504TV76_9HYPH|nr:IS3 family transposase [Rhizobium glycinendophyticum]